jgi:hypothetical protein
MLSKLFLFNYFINLLTLGVQMRNLTTFFLLFFLYFIVSLFSTVFAQSINVQQIPPIKDELRENYSQGDYENFLLREKLGEIPFQGGIVDQIAGTDALVNNNTGSTGTSNFTQSETSILAFGSTVLIGFNDSGSFTGVQINSQDFPIQLTAVQLLWMAVPYQQAVSVMLVILFWQEMKAPEEYIFQHLVLAVQVPFRYSVQMMVVSPGWHRSLVHRAEVPRTNNG